MPELTYRRDFANEAGEGSVIIYGDEIELSVETGRMMPSRRCTLADFLDEPPRTDGWSTFRETVRRWSPEIADDLEREVRRRLNRPSTPGTGG